MPSSIFSLASYREGIHRAHKAGHITHVDSYVPESGEMRFSNHISWDIKGIHLLSQGIGSAFRRIRRHI
jgi:hypothetical protein